MRSTVFTKLFIVSLIFLMYPVPGKSQQKIYRFSENGLAETSRVTLPGYTISKESNQVLELDFSFEDFMVFDMKTQDQDFQLVRVEGFGLNEEVGTPALPLKTEKIIIPDGKVAHVKVDPGEYEEITDILLYPVQEQAVDGIRKASAFSWNKQAYKRHGFLPLRLAEITNEQTFRGVNLGYLQIRPAQYNAATHTLRIYKEMKITIDFVDTLRTQAPERRVLGSSAYDVLRNSVINKKTIPKNTTESKSSYDVDPIGYLILTVPEFEEAADTLAQWKRQLGYHVEIHTQASWTDPQVKSLVSDVYHNSSYSFEYLLIIGDQQHIPDHYMYYTDGGNPWHIYSENYYVCMDGSSDYVPEMAHGRISVNSAEQAMLVVNKILKYEKDPPTDPNFYTKGLHAGYFQDSTFDGVSDYRYCRTTLEMYDYMTQQEGFNSDLVLYAEPASDPHYFNPTFSGVTNVPSQYLRSNGYAWDGNKDDILADLNEGRLYAFHRDHGLKDQWMAPNFTVSHMDGLHNGDKLPIVFSINCGTGKFVEPEPFVCFSEKLQRFPNGGAVGIVSATAETKSGFNDAFIIGMMDAIWSSPGIIPDLGDCAELDGVTSHGPIYKMGDVMLQGLLRMTETEGTNWADMFQYQLYHYFGDPAMQVWTQLPVQMTASHTDHVEVGATWLSLASVNASDALATITVGDQLIAKSVITNHNGTLYFPAIDASVSKITLTISKHNYIPYVVEIDVMKTPVPDFEADVTEICTGEVVSFTDQSTGVIDSWSWDTDPAGGAVFVNGTNSSTQNPKIRFNNSGYYTVSLTVSNSYGSETENKANLIHVYAIPSAPVADGATLCSYDEVPELSASGSNVKWYAEEAMTTLLHEGSTYTPASVAVGTTTFYINQTVNGCVSDAGSVDVTMYPATNVPEVSADAVCEYDTARLSASGVDVRWYADSLGNELEAEDALLELYPLAAGEYKYYASSMQNNCESDLVACTVLVKPQPEPPYAEDLELCEGDSAVLTAEGEHIYWYAESDLNHPRYFGNSYDAGVPDPGTYDFLLTQEIANCTSEASGVTITVHSLPVFSLGVDTLIYYEDTLMLHSSVSGTYTWSDQTSDSITTFVGSAYGLGYHTVWLEVSSENNCTYSDTLVVEVQELIDSVPTLFQGNVIKVYPNPTTGDMKLKFIQAVSKPVNVVITDPKGSLIYKEERVAGDPQQPLEINLTGIDKGIYFMSVYNEDLIYTLSFIKQ